MHSILRNMSLLKTSLAQKQSCSLHILEYSSKFPKISRYAIRPPIIVEHMKYSTISSEEYVTNINKQYRWLDIPKNKNFSSSLTKISYRTNQKFRRFFCQNTSKKSERDIRRRQLDKIDQLRRDNIYVEDCINAREEKCKKKHIKKKVDIKFTVNLNNIINELNKNKNLKEQHEINKINNFIFKPIDCKSCSQKRSSSKKLSYVNHQKRRNSSYSVTKKYYPRYEKKQEKFQRQLYAETATYKPRLELLAFLNDNKNEKGTILVKSQTNFTNLRSKSTVPLFLLVKCNSVKAKTSNNSTRNVKYKVGTNQALIKVHSETKKSDENSLFLKPQYRFVNNHKDCNNQIANFDNIFNRTEKSTEKKLQVYRYQTGSKIQAPKPVLAKAIYELLRPLIEQEYLQCKEVKEAIERLERNLQYHFKMNRNEGSESQVYKSLSDINQLRTKQSQLNLPDNKSNEIKDPKTDLEIIDPLNNNNRKGDPIIKSSISVPCLKKEEIFDPIEYEITIIAKDCFEKINKNKNGGCDGNNRSQDKKADPCKKENEPCKQEKKPCEQEKEPSKQEKEPCKQEKEPCKQNKDPCKQNEEPCKQNKEPCKQNKEPCKQNKEPCNQEKENDPCKAKEKETPCKKTRKENSKCEKNKGKDLCSKNKEELCKDKQKHDQCKNKNPPTPKKQSGPCDKEDPCGESSSAKDDCFKQGSPKKQSDSSDHSCMKPKKKVDNSFAATSYCAGNKDASRKDISKKSDQSCNKDPCKSFKENSKTIKRDPCGRNDKKMENPCKQIKEVTTCKGTEPKKDKEVCMKPSEVKCPKGNSITPRPCCEQVCVCEEPKLPVIKPTCSDEEPKRGRIANEEKGPDQCKPMPMDCPMKINAEGKSQQGESVSCKQKGCSEKSMEPTEPPNCCKPRKKSVVGECSRTFENQQVVQDNPDLRQIPCQELIQQQEKSARHTKAPPCPSPPNTSQTKKEKPRCPSPSKADTRYCSKSSKEEYVPEQAKPAKTPGRPCNDNISQKPHPESREPQQAAKDTWKPVKIKGSNCQLRYAKSSPCTKMEKASDKTSAGSSSDKPKEECSQKGFLGSCKGIFSSVYSMLCPGKNKKSGKKAASIGLMSSLSLPELRGLTAGTLSGSSGNNRGKKKPGTMTFALYKTKDRYPWRNTNRWILRNERFFSKIHKKFDPCSKENEEIAPESNKLNCICYEEMKKASLRNLKNQSGAEDTCVKMGNVENKKEPTMRLNFKLTDHSKICKAANKTKGNAKNEKCASDSKRDQSKFNQCGELIKHNKSGNVEVEMVQSDNSNSKSKDDAYNTKEGQAQPCINKLKTSPETKGSEEQIERNQEQPKLCMDKLINTVETRKKDGAIKQKQKNACLGKLKPSAEPVHKEDSTAGKQKNTPVDCQFRKKPSSASRSKRKSSIREKYPWKKSEPKMDAELCPNQSSITARSSEKNYPGENVCSKPKIESNMMEKDKGKQDGKKDYSLEIKKDSSCFQGQGMNKECNTDKDEDICDRMDKKQHIKKDLSCFKSQRLKKKSDTDKDRDICDRMDKKQALTPGESHKKETFCAKLNTKKPKEEQEKDDKFPKDLQGNHNKNKSNILDIKKDPSCFESQEKQSQSDVKCPNSEGESKSIKQKYSLDHQSRESTCFKDSGRKTEHDQTNEKDEKDCKNVENHSPRNTCGGISSTQNEKETVNQKENECKKQNNQNLLENFNKQVEKMSVRGENASGKYKLETICAMRNQEDSQTVKTKDENKKAGNITEDICSKMKQIQSKEGKTKDEDSKIKSQEQNTQSGKNASEYRDKKNQDCSKRENENKRAAKTTQDICSKITLKQKSEEKTKIEDDKNKCQTQVTYKSSTRQKDSLNLSGFLLNENEEDMFICKVKKLGKSEQFICNPKGEECNELHEQAKGVVRVLKCRLTKDDRGRDVFVCREMKPTAVGNESSEDGDLRMKRLLKPRSSPQPTSNKMVVSKKLVCTNKTRDENDGVKKELMCNIHEVREMIEDKKIRKESCDENYNKKSPVTYKDLLKISKKIRKTGNVDCLKRDMAEKRKDCKDKLRT